MCYASNNSFICFAFFSLLLARCVLHHPDKIPSSFANSKRRGSNIRASPASSISDMTSPSLSSCWGGAESEDGVLIPPGEHNFHFEFTLPKNLPSTYSGRWGAVRYSVKSVLERPWKFDIEREYEFTLTANMDLNEEPDLLVSMTVKIIQSGKHT